MDPLVKQVKDILEASDPDTKVVDIGAFRSGVNRDDPEPAPSVKPYGLNTVSATPKGLTV
jgi:hypothetical protein